jgi:AraC-like DNA-binding protein
MVPASSPRSESLMLQFPRKLLPLPERQAARLLAVPLQGRQGMGRLLAQFLRTAADEEAPYSAPDLVRLAGTAIDLVAAVLAHHLERDRDLPPDSRRRALFLRVSDDVRQHLGEPDLGPARLAAAHHISTRHLHRVFQQHGTSVAAFIRRHRLDRCRRDLADPALRAVPVHGIAARWGFPQPGAFTRLFRSATGLTPTEYRAAHLPHAITGEARHDASG